MFSFLIWVLDTNIFTLRKLTDTLLLCATHQLKVQKYVWGMYVASKNLQKEIVHLNMSSAYGW